MMKKHMLFLLLVSGIGSNVSAGGFVIPLDQLMLDMTHAMQEDFARTARAINRCQNGIEEETEEDIKLQYEVPGFNKNTLDIEFLNDESLRISSVEPEEMESENNQTKRCLSKFYRKVTLPCRVNTESVKASVTDGILKIVVQKKVNVDARKVTIE
jgi:HSP20 family molecular chaperone IbpA